MVMDALQAPLKYYILLLILTSCARVSDSTILAESGSCSILRYHMVSSFDHSWQYVLDCNSDSVNLVVSSKPGYVELLEDTELLSVRYCDAGTRVFLGADVQLIDRRYETDWEKIVLEDTPDLCVIKFETTNEDRPL